MSSQEGMKGAVFCQATKVIGKIIIGTCSREERFMFSRMCGLHRDSLRGWEGCDLKSHIRPPLRLDIRSSEDKTLGDLQTTARGRRLPELTCHLGRLSVLYHFVDGSPSWAAWELVFGVCSF